MIQMPVRREKRQLKISKLQSYIFDVPEQLLLLIFHIACRINQQHLPTVVDHIGIGTKGTELKLLYLQHS